MRSGRNFAMNGRVYVVTLFLQERSLLNTAILSGKLIYHEMNIFSVSQDNTFRDVTKDSLCRSLDPQVVKVNRPCLLPAFQ